MSDQIRYESVRQVIIWDGSNPVAKFGHQLAQRDPGQFHATVAKGIAGYIDSSSPLAGIAQQELCDHVRNAYQHLADQKSPVYGYAALPPGSKVPPLVPGPDNYNPAAGYQIATLLAHLPLKGEPIESACCIGPDGMIVAGPLSHLGEASRLAPGKQEVCYSVVDRHGNSYRVRSANDEFQSAELVNQSAFARRHRLSPEKLAFTYQREVFSMLKDHFGIENGERTIAKDTLDRLLSHSIASHEYVNHLAARMGYVRCDGEDPLAPVTLEHEHLARVRGFIFTDTEDAILPWHQLDLNANDPGMLVGDVVVAVEEQVVGIVTIKGIKAITASNQKFDRLDSTETDLVSPYSLEVAKRAVEHYQFPMPEPAATMKM